MNYLDQKLQRAMRGGDVGGMQEVASQAARFGSRDIMRQAERGLRDYVKAQEKAQREMIRAQRDAQRQADRQAREAERAARQQAGDYKDKDIAFFTRGSGESRKVIPITAPSGGVMKKWGNSGVLWDSNTGLPYAMDPKTMAMTQIDPEADGKTIVKDGHVYKVVEGLPWKWVGFDPEKVGNNPALAKELAAKTADAKREADMASDKASATRKLIADNEKAIKALEKDINLKSGDERTRIQGEIDQLKGKNKGLRERLELEQIDAHKKAAYRQQVESANDQRLAEDLASRQKMAYQGDPKGGLGLQSALDRISKAQQNASSYSDPVTALLDNILQSGLKDIDAEREINQMTAALANHWNQSSAERQKAREQEMRNKASAQNLASMQEKWASGSLDLTKLAATKGIRPEVAQKINDFMAKTGLTKIPNSWNTPEAQEARANAGMFGLYDVKLPQNFVLSKGAITTTPDEQASIWGVKMPWNTKGQPVDVGTYQFDRNGVPFIELNKDNRLSPSQLSGNPLDGVKEYLPMPKDWAEQFKPTKPSDFSLSMLPADKRREVMDSYKNELATYQQTAKDAWAGQKMDAERFNDTLTRWTVATPAQRQEMIAELDPSQKDIPASQRRLNTRALFEAGMISAQEGRLLERSFYGTDPVMPNVNEAFDDWMKNSNSQAATKLRKDLEAAATMERPKAPGVFGKFQSFVEQFAGPIGNAVLDAQTASERSRAKWDLIDSAKREFLTEYRNDNALRVDYNPAAFVELRGKLMDNKPMGAWANQTATNFLAQAVGPMTGMASGTVQLAIDSAFSNLTGRKLLTDQERDLITQQTGQAAANMDRAIQERGGFWGVLDTAKNLTNPLSFQNIVGAYAMGPQRYADALFTAANEGKTGMQINRIFNDIQNDIDYERMDRQKLDAYQTKLTPLLNEFAAMGEKAYARTGSKAQSVAQFLTGSDATLSMRRAPQENSLTDPNSAIAQALAGFRQTGDLAYMDMAKSAAFNSGAELALSKALSDHASMGGRISATTFGSPYLTAYRSGMVAPITEGALELGTNIAAVLTGGSLKLLQVAGSAARAGSAMSKVGRAVAALDDVATAYNKAGLITRNPGTALTFGQAAWNTGLQAGKQILASSGGEFFQESVAAFGQAGATLGDSFNQGVQGAIFGVGMSAVHYPAGAAISQVQQMRREAAETKALTQFVADYNKHNNTGTQLTLDVARQAQAYQSPELVRTLATQRQDLLTRQADITQALRNLPAEPQARPGAIPYTPNPRRVELLNQQAEIKAALAANLLDTAAVSEMSINSAREINALPPGQREVVDAAIRAANGVPLSVSQESTLLNHTTASGKPAAYTYGDDIVLTDEFREEIKQAAPETAKAPVLRKTQAERDAELRAKYGGVFRNVGGKVVFVADKKPATPVQPTSPTIPAPAGNLQVSNRTRYEELKRKAEGTPERQIVLPDGRQSTSPARPPQPLTPAEQQEFNQLQAQMEPTTPTTPTVPVQPTTSAPASPQTPTPIQVTPPVTQNFQTLDGAQVTGTFEKQPDGSWQQTSPEAPIFTVTPENTQFFQTLEDKAAYALNPQAPDAVQPGEFGQEGYTATEPAPQGSATTAQDTAQAETTTEAAPPELPAADVFTQPVNRGTALLMLQTAAPWVSGAPIVVRSPRFFLRGNRVVDAKTYAELPKQERARYTPSPSAMFAHQGKVYVDETALVEYLSGTAPEARQEKLKAAMREEVIHVATMNVRNRAEVIQDWQTLPDTAKQRVVETYFTAELEAAGGDWTQVEVDEYQAGAEFWRMYLTSITEGRTTEQVDMASEVADYAATNPTFAQRLKDALQDIARWLREELLGQLDPDTRAEFEQTAAKIDAEVAKLDAMLGITPQPATPAAEAASPMAAPVPEANAPPVSAVEPAETIDTPAAPLTRLPEKAAPRNQAFVPKPAVGAMKWKQEAVNTALTSAAGSFGYKIVDTGIPSSYTAYGETLNYGTALYDKLNPGDEIGKWIDAMNAGTNPAGNAIIQAASEPGLHRVWYGHDFFTNVDDVAAQFGWSEVPSYIIQLLKDGLTRSGLPLPGVELLVQSGAVSDRVATDWLSTNIGEVFGGGLSFLGTYKLYKAARGGRLSKPQVIFATVGIGLKLVSGVMTAQPFLILSGLADTAILVTNLDQVKAAFKKGIQEFNKKPQAVRDLYERVAAPTAVAPVSQESSTPQDGREVKLPGSYPGDAGSTPAPATTLPVQPVESVEATPPPLPPEEVVTSEQEVVTDEPAPPPLPPETQADALVEPVQQAAPTIKMAQAAKTLGVTPKELLRLVKAAVIPAQKSGNNYLFTQEALDAYAADRANKQAPILEKLAAVAGNTATEADVADLRQRGLVDIYRGERVINQKGYDLMAKAGIAPRLTRNQRVQEIDDQLGPVEKPASDIALNPRVTKSGRLYLVRSPQGGTPAQVPITDDAQARTEANRIAAEFDAKEAELEARAAELEQDAEPTAEEDGMPEMSDEDAALVPKFFNLFADQVRTYREARERGESTPESLERLVTQAVAVAKRLGMSNLHPGTLLLNMSRLPVGPLMRSQATLIDAVHDVLQDGTRDIAPADLTLKAGIASPAGFTNRDSSPLSWAQLIQLGALKATPRPDGSLRVRMGKTPEQMKAEAEQAEVEAMQREYLDELRGDIEEIGGLEGAGVGRELLSAIESFGGIPEPDGKNAGNFTGELKILKEDAKAAARDIKTAVKGTYKSEPIVVSRLFRKDAPGLDAVAEFLRGHGFETLLPDDVINLLQERFARKRPMYGTTTDFDDGLGERAVAAKPRVQLANASITTEAGPIFLKKAHHGTPHKVDRFSLDKIGTGEGAQAYGWGLYFAENTNVADEYRRTLAKRAGVTDAWFLRPIDSATARYREVINYADAAPMAISQTLSSLNATEADAPRIARELAASARKPEYIKAYNDIADMIESGEVVVSIPTGNLYSVELDVDDADLLDWDAPLSAQSPKVQAALKAVQSDHWLWNETISGKLGDPVGGAVYKDLTATWPDAEFSRDGIDPKKKASEALLAAGIPGIRYLDEGSRGQKPEVRFDTGVKRWLVEWDEGFGRRKILSSHKTEQEAKAAANNERTYNFVIFDENLIRITAENGETVGNAEVVKNLMAETPTAGMLQEDGIPGALPLDAAGGLAESGARPGAQPAQGAAPARPVDARQGELGIPAEAAFAGIAYRPARIWGLQALADRFLQLRNSVGGQPIQPPIFRKNFATRQAAFTEAAQAAERLYRETLANVDAVYADRRGRADSLLPRLPEVRALFTDANGEVQLLGSRPVELDAGEALFAKSRRTAPHQLDLFSDNYNQTAKPWTPSWQAKEPAKVEGETDAPPLALESQTEGTGRIEDFGEKLQGARKDLWQRYTDMVMADLPEDARDITLAKYLPEPDYEAMIASGMESARVAAVKALRDVIPRKPSSGYKLAAWTKMVRDLRPLIQRLIDPTNPIPLDKFQLAIADSREIRDMVNFYQDLGWPHFTQAKGWKIKQSQGYVRWNGEPVAKGTIVTYMSQDYRTFPALASLDPDGNWRQGYTATLQKFRDYLDAQAAQAKEPKKIDFQIYSDTQSGDVFIGKKGASGVIRLQTGFASAKEARNWLTDHYNDLTLKWEGMRQEPVLRRASNEPRTGPKRREGDVTPEMFTEAFGFRGVQFGNYVEGDRRQRDLNNAFDAFMDLAEALGIPAKALSFDGSLGLAFGARGRGGKRPAAAHYEPGEVVINLTKNSGPGSLAHEWFHALDNYFARLERTGSTAPKSIDEWATRAMATPRNVRPEVMEAFRAVRNSLGGDLDKRSRALDSTRSAPYYSQTIEKAARAFETYVIDRLGKSSVTNDYLANIDPTSEAYPRPNEMDGGIRQAFDTLFTTLDTRQGERGTMLFAKPRQAKMDADYLAAVERGDMETAQRMVDEDAINEGSEQRLWKVSDYAQPSLEKVLSKIKGLQLTNPQNPKAILIDVWGGGVARYRRGWAVQHNNGTVAFYSDKAGRVQSTNVTESTRIAPDWLIVERSYGEILDPTTFQTGRPTILFARHFTRPQVAVKIAAQGKLKKIGSLYNNPNEMLGLFAIAYDDDQWAGGQDYGGESIGGYVRLENPLVLTGVDITDMSEREIVALQERVKEQNHDGIIYQSSAVAPEQIAEQRSSLPALVAMPTVQKQIDTAIREQANYYRDEISKATQQDRSQWAMSGLEAILSNAITPASKKGEIRTTASAVQAVRRWFLSRTKVGQRIAEQQAAFAKSSATLKDGEAVFDTPWVIVPWDKVNTRWKSADPVTYDSTGAVIPLSQRFNPESDSILFAKPRRQLASGGFYLKSAEVLDSKIQGKQASLEQVKALLENNGIKTEELKWTGVVQEAERLAKENNGKVPKEDLLAFLAADGAVELREAFFGALPPKTQTTRLGVANLEGNFMQWADGLTPENIKSIQDVGFTLQQFPSDIDQNAREAKYSQYQLPGGKNYREVVLAMPEHRLAPAEAAERNALKLKPKLSPPELERLAYLNGLEIGGVHNPTTYTSTHFDTPNYIAHMRLNERADAEGRPGLFIEELQSDRHQQGREKGYISDQEAELNAARKEYEKLAIQNAIGKLNQQEKARLSELRPIVSGQGSVTPGVPDAPFRTTWPVQLFKRALRDAVASGKDWIGWTDGLTQVDRYTEALRQRVRSIEWTREDGLTVVDVQPTNGKRIYLPVKDGKIYRTADQQSLVGKDLSEVIGKEAAAKVNEANSGRLAGENLTIGGEGMKGFYDNMVPKEVAKYVKQWGGKVEKSEIGQEITNDDLGMEGLEDATPEELAEFYANGKVVGEAVPIWRVDITPQMRESVESGQPLFAKARPMRDTTGELFGDETPFNLIGETLPPTAPARPDTVVDAQAREQAFRQSGREDVGDLFGEPAQAIQAMPERIAATAVIDKDGTVLSSPSKTHAELMEETKFDLDGGEFPPTQNFGFVTTTGRFVEQKEAQQIAQQARQVQGNQPISGEIVTELQREGLLTPAQEIPSPAMSGRRSEGAAAPSATFPTPAQQSLFTEPVTGQGTLFDISPVGPRTWTQAEAARTITKEKTAEVLKGSNLESRDISTYEKAVAANNAHMGTLASEWSAVPIDEVVFENGESIPKYDAAATQDYKAAPTLYPGEANYPACQWCGKQPVRQLFQIKHDGKKLTLQAGSECITHFEEASGDRMLQDAKNKKNLADITAIRDARSELRNEFFQSRTDSYGRTQSVWKNYDAEQIYNKLNTGNIDTDSGPAALTRWAKTKGPAAKQAMQEFSAFMADPKTVQQRIKQRESMLRSWEYRLEPQYAAKFLKDYEVESLKRQKEKLESEIAELSGSMPLFAKPARDVTKRNAAVQQAAQDYFDRKISQEEYLATVRAEMPYMPMAEVPAPASAAEMEVISKDKKPKLFKAGETLRAGDKVGLRLDIPAYWDHGVWIVAVHEPGTKSGAGTPIGYEPVARIRNATFVSNPKAALNIARGTAKKSTIARMVGEWVPSTPEEARQLAESAMNDPQWVQVGMNPFRHSWFYNRATGVPVVSAEDVVQVGGLVLAKNPVYTTPYDTRFDAGGGALFAKPRQTKQDADYLAAVERGDMETAQRMVDEAEQAEAENNFEIKYGSKIFGEYPKASKVLSRLSGTLKGHIPVPVAMLQTGVNGNKYYVRSLVVEDDNGLHYGFYNDRNGRTQVIRNASENFGIWDDPAARNSYLEIAELIGKRAKFPANTAKFKEFGIDWWATQGDIKPQATLKDFIEWEFLDDEIKEVKVRRGTPTTGWNKAATKAGYQHLPVNKFKDGTEIIINTGDKEFFATPSDLFASLIHETVHLIQAKEGRLYKSLQDDSNYRTNDIEREARDAAATIPLLEWAENNLGDYIPGKSNINHPHSLPPAASAVITDDAGNVIPLSERFNPESDSILFAKPRKPRPSSLLAETKGKVVAGTAVGTRNPTGKAAQEAGTDRSALVDLASMRRDPELFRKNAVLLANFPLVARQVPEAAKLVRTISAPLEQARGQFAEASKRLEDARNELKAELARREGVRPNKIKVTEVDKLEQGDTEVAEGDRVIKRHLAQIAKARKIQDAFRDKRDKKQAEFDANSKALLAGKKFPIELADRVYAALKTAAVRNLELLIELFPADLRDTARLWYDGANIIAQDFAARYNTTLNRSSAVLAVFSPQKDWFMNVALGQRMMNIWANHQNTRFDDAMAKQYLMRAGEPEPQWDKKTDDYKRDAKGDLVYTKGAKPIRDEEGNITGWENWDNEKAKEKFDKAQKDLAIMRGKKLSELQPHEQARFIRMWSEVYDAPGFPVVTPAGTFGNNKLSEKGNEQRLAWGSYVTIEKAIAILTAPATSEMQVISNELGVQHKVRSFYNNIVDPANADGHVTMDTHAIAAILWQALSGNSPEVTMNFGGGGASGNSNLGISGLYPAFAEAYREVAAEFGLLPREVQSITWESVRLLFPAKFKSQKANVAKVREVWDQHEQGTITTQQAHDRIYQLVDEWKRRSTLKGEPGKTAAAAIADGSGVGRPDWAEVTRSGADNSANTQGTADAGGLPDSGRRGDGTGRPAVGRRSAGRDARLLPATPKGRQSGAVLGAKPRRADWPAMLERANDISVQEFAALARGGKLNEATGEPNPMEAGTGTTPISIGAAAGYPLEDIAHFYIARQLPEKFNDRAEATRLVSQVIRSEKDAAKSNTILRAFDRFAADAATEAQAEAQAEALFAKPRRTPPPLPPMEKRIEASLDAIENWNNVLRAAEEKPAGTSIRKLSTEIRDAVPLGFYMFYMNFLRGRLDRADALAPGVKSLIEKANQEEQMVQVGLAAVVDGLRNELKKSFGDPAFWSKNRARLKEATRLLLPVASYLQPERAGVDGGFVWREFERRSGTISQMEATDLKIKDGELFEYEGRVVRLGEYIPEWQSFVLLEPVSVEMQDAIYEQFFYTFPEALPILDRWITPDLADAFTVGEGSTLAVEFNREALLNYYNTWPKDLIESLEGVFPQVPRVEGYTPDIATQKAQVNVIAHLLGKSKSPGRKFKSGALREAGKVQNLIDAFSTRAMQAHREKIRLRMREGIIEKAVVPRMSIPAENMGDFISLEDTFSDLVTAVETARYLDPKAYPNLSRALNPKDQMQLMRLVGDAARLRAGEMMIHKKVHSELMMSMAREQTEGKIYKFLDWVLRAVKLGLLTVGSGQINWLSNQLQRWVQTYNTFLFSTFALMLGEKRGSKRGMYNFLYLLRGLVTDNMPNSFFNRERIGGLIPYQVFEELTLLGSTDQERAVGSIVEDVYRKGFAKGISTGVKEALKNGGAAGPVLYLVNYSGGDVAVKQTTVYAAMQARAAVAADEAGIKKNRTEWKRKWIRKQINEFTKEWQQALAMAGLYYMDYKNVPSPIAPETTIIPANAPYGAIGPKAMKLWKTHGFIFVKWGYNWLRFGKRMSIDSLLTSVDPESTKEERAQAFANLATLMTIAFLGSWLLQPADDEENEPIIGSRIDEDGKLRERHEDTSGRLNLSAFARNLKRSRIAKGFVGESLGWAVDKTGLGQLTQGLLKMSGLTVNADFTNHRGDDYWMWYRNITWLPELFLAGKLVNGDLKGFLRDGGAYIADMASLGVLSKIGGVAQASSQDASKEPINLITEAVFDIVTAPIAPPQMVKYGSALIDPTIRRRTDNEALGFDMTPLTTIQSKIPGLTKSLPPAGKPILPVLFSQNYDEYRAYEAALKNLNKRKNLTGEQRDAEHAKITEKFQRRNAQKNGIDIREVMFGMGLDPTKTTTRPTTRDVLSDLIELQAKGVGPSGVRVYQEQLDDGSVQPYMVYVDPDTIPTRDRALTLFKVFAGPNIRPFPKPPKKTPEQPALTPDFMFGGQEQQANLTLPRQ